MGFHRVKPLLDILKREASSIFKGKLLAFL